MGLGSIEVSLPRTLFRLRCAKLRTLNILGSARPCWSNPGRIRRRTWRSSCRTDDNQELVAWSPSPNPKSTRAVHADHRTVTPPCAPLRRFGDTCHTPTQSAGHDRTRPATRGENQPASLLDHAAASNWSKRDAHNADGAEHTYADVNSSAVEPDASAQPPGKPGWPTSRPAHLRSTAAERHPCQPRSRRSDAARSRQDQFG